VCGPLTSKVHGKWEYAVLKLENEPMTRAEEGREHRRHTFLRHNVKDGSRLFWNLITGLGGGHMYMTCTCSCNFLRGVSDAGPDFFRCIKVCEKRVYAVLKIKVRRKSP